MVNNSNVIMQAYLLNSHGEESNGNGEGKASPKKVKMLRSGKVYGMERVTTVTTFPLKKYICTKFSLHTDATYQKQFNSSFARELVLMT